MRKSIKDFLEIIKSRGFIHQTTDLNLLQREHLRITGYTGFDCTANTLHVGSLLQLMLLRWLQKTENKPIVLIGGGTTRIGDPSGKDTTRKILDQSLNIPFPCSGLVKTYSVHLLIILPSHSAK